MADERDGRGRFRPGVSGNPGGRSSKSAKLARQMLDTYAEPLMQELIFQALSGDASALKLCVSRLLPPYRPAAEAVEVPGVATAESLRAKAAAVLDELAGGNISPDAAKDILRAVAAVAKAEEVEELKRQVEELTALIKARGLI